MSELGSKGGGGVSESREGGKEQVSEWVMQGERK